VNLTERVVEAAERGWLPDAWIRFGIRRLLSHRRREIASSLRRTSVTSDLSLGPLAIETRAANEQHYELPPAFFETVLGRHLKYSSCYWPESVGSLDEAEHAALALTAERARIEDGQKILDLGCGWGSFTLWIAERYPRCRLTAVSNSAAQGQYIRRLAAARGLENVETLTADINQLALPGGYDRVVSIEMIEHVRNYRLLTERLAGWLDPQGLVFLHHFCHRSTPYLFEDAGSGDWMARHFFTGGVMPSEHLLDEFAGPLQRVDRWRLNGKHYQKTALAWLDRMDAHEKRIGRLFEATYGADAERWRERWRLFFLAVAELFGAQQGNEWFVSHSLWSRDPGSDPAAIADLLQHHRPDA
jgi:cyclopropane-fatty-acyl-phospholipid synthase